MIVAYFRGDFESMTFPANEAGLEIADPVRFRVEFERAIAVMSATDSPPELTVDWLDSPVGPLLIGASQTALCLLEFCALEGLDAQCERLQRRLGRQGVRARSPILDAARAQLSEYFAGTRRSFDLPCCVSGSGFQERVWAALRDIPYGTTCSYGDIAHRLGDKHAMRAVGAANAANPIAIVIPCHRVVNASGDLGGFGGGARRKQILLDLEHGQRGLFGA